MKNFLRVTIVLLLLAATGSTATQKPSSKNGFGLPTADLACHHPPCARDFFGRHSVGSPRPSWRAVTDRLWERHYELIAENLTRFLKGSHC
jgi:hypothetical protein